VRNGPLPHPTSVFVPRSRATQNRSFSRLPERCANLTFGGPKNNCLYMTSCHSLHALYVEAHRAT
jgi:sugar lactone lactonase YvrE